MGFRTIVISNICKLDYKMNYLVIRNESETQRIFLDEISLLMIENPAISLTGCLLEELSNKKIKVVFCDKTRNPVAELVPYYGSHDTSKKVRQQIVWSDESKAIVWKEIVKDKIFHQSAFLKVLQKNEESELLKKYIGEVEPGDITNREAHAAKVYFNALFGMDFSRKNSNPINSSLNYGYGILLSLVNREIVSNGYITQTGIFHDNVFNPFNLTCDIMEPYRIIVDRVVYNLKPKEFGTNEKHKILQFIDTSVVINNNKQTLANSLKLYCKSVLDAICESDVSQIRIYRLEDEL